MAPSHVLVCPFGQPASPSSREHWVAQLGRCGADFARIIDGPTASLEQFARHLGRVAVLRNPRTPVIVALARSQPLAISLMGSRRALAGAAPALSQALWVVYVDPREDTAFLRTAQQLGDLDASLEDAPIWTSPSDDRYLVLSPVLRDLEVLPFRMTDLQHGGECGTGVVPRTLPPEAGPAPVTPGRSPQGIPDAEELEVPQLGARRRG